MNTTTATGSRRTTATAPGHHVGTARPEEIARTSDTPPPPAADGPPAAAGPDRRLWDDGLRRAAGLTGGVLLLLLLALVLWRADPVHHDVHGLPGLAAGFAGAALTGLSAVRARVYRDRAGSVALGLGGLPLLLVAGCGIVAADPGQGPGRLQFLLGCVTVLAASTLLIVLTPEGDAPFVASASAAATGTLAAFASVLDGAPPSHAAAVCAVAAVGATAFLPALSARIARVPIGHESPSGAPDGGADAADGTAAVAALARRGHELLLGLVGGVAAVVLCSAAVLGLQTSAAAQLLCAATGTAVLTRARMFRHTAQVSCLLAAGFGALALPVLGLSLNPPPDLVRDLLAGDRAPADLRALCLAVTVAVGAAVFTAVATAVPRKGLPPLPGRVLELAEDAVLLSLVPLCLAVLDAYAAARGMG